MGPTRPTLHQSIFRCRRLRPPHRPRQCLPLHRHVSQAPNALILWLACSAVFFEAFDVSIVNLALPAISAELHTPLADAQWVQTLYLLAFGGFLLLGGRLCDHYGSKKIFLAGMLLFCASSALAFASHHFAVLLAARALQGAGAALAIPGGISLLSRHFPKAGNAVLP